MQPREIKQKIKLTQSIRQITRALEMVAAVKMRKAQRIVVISRPFAKKIVWILKRLAEHQKAAGEDKSLFFKEKEVKKILAVVASSDRGFCGNFNQNILKFSQKEIEKLAETAEVEIAAIGKKTINFFKKKGFKIKAEFTGIGDYVLPKEVYPIADLLISSFRENDYQKIYLFYTDFISTFVQKPRKIQIFPIIPAILEDFLKERTGETREEAKHDYIFEPSVAEIFEVVVPQLIKYGLYQAILEVNASEHSARMMAMRNASKNAEDMRGKLILEYNKLRQNQITNEVCEISSAKKAMEKIYA